MMVVAEVFTLKRGLLDEAVYVNRWQLLEPYELETLTYGS